MRLIGFLMFALTLGLVTPQSSYAQPRYSFSFTNVADIALGNSQLVTVNIAWNGTGTNDLFTFGINSGNLAIRISNASVGSVYVMPNTSDFPVLGTDILPNPAFSDTSLTYSQDLLDAFGSVTGQGNLNGVLLAFPGTLGAKPADGSAGTLLPLAQFKLTGNLVGAVTIHAGFVDPTVNTNFSYGANSSSPFDDLISQGTVAFNVVPEPATWAMMILSIAAGFGGVVWYRRQRLNQANHQLATLEEAITE